MAMENFNRYAGVIDGFLYPILQDLPVGVFRNNYFCTQLLQVNSPQRVKRII